jgi:putative hemolysin
MSLPLIAILASLVFSAYFSAIELAFISANKLHITLQHKKGKLWASIIVRFMERPSLFITAMLIGNTISLVVYGSFMAQILDPQVQYVVETWFQLQGGTLDVVVLIASSLLSTMLVLAVAEFLPKSVSLINPLNLLIAFALPTRIIYSLLYPFVYAIVSLTKLLIVKVLRLEYSEKNPVFGLTDLNHYLSSLSQNEDNETDVDTKIFSKALDFKSVRVRDSMVPRTDIVAVDKTVGIGELQQVFVDSGHSKVLVYEDSVDNMVGYCHCLDMFKKPETIQAILQPLMIVPETILANEVMVQFIASHRSIALVVDEFGGTAGIVTIEDLMEEIFGEIDDEYDIEGDEVERIDADTFIVSARLEIDYLNEKYGWGLPEGDYETLGGYILAETEDIPAPETVVETDGFAFTILSLQDEVRIGSVRMTLKNPERSGVKPVL